jgi:hypothetical protein
VAQGAYDVLGGGSYGPKKECRIKEHLGSCTPGTRRPPRFRNQSPPRVWRGDFLLSFS